ncbi:MAG TPA: HPr-rel-A system PqqD family peptide chaperone [Actinomycetota bacterium]|nr:HPr-rel-A system PqqD family peptide chaperone [Actinomycetota bacterium]
MSDNRDAVARDPAPDAITVPLTYRPRKRSDVLELDMGDGFILYNHDSSLVHHLNPTAAVVWQVLDGTATVERLADEIADEYGVPVENVAMQVTSLIAELDAMGLVEDASPEASAE